MCGRDITPTGGGSRLPAVQPPVAAQEAALAWAPHTTLCHSNTPRQAWQQYWSLLRVPVVLAL